MGSRRQGSAARTRERVVRVMRVTYAVFLWRVWSIDWSDTISTMRHESVSWPQPIIGDKIRTQNWKRR